MNQHINHPLIISIESSQATCGVCITSANLLIAENTIYQGNLHDKLLAELIRRILNDLSIDIEQIDAVALSSGPGSFTGLRIGASLAKAICFDNKIKLISVPTLASLAYYSMKHKNLSHQRIIPIVPSHKQYIYYQIFDNSMNQLSEVKYDEITILRSLDDGMSIFCSPIQKLSEEFSNFIEIELNPKIIAEYGICKYQSSEFTNAEEFVPLYIQEFRPKISLKNTGEIK